MLPLALALGAQNLVKNGSGEAEIKNWDPEQIQVATEHPHTGKSCFKTIVPSVIGTAIIPVDGTKTYKYTGWFKSADAQKPTVFFGLSPLTENKKAINSLNINAMPATEAVLAEACTPDDTIIKIKNISNWNVDDGNAFIAFDVDDSGEYKDLPNFNVATSEVLKVERKDAVFEATLKRACEMNYSAGTKIRLHHSGGYLYAAHIKEFQSNEWTQISGEIQGTSKDGDRARGKQFWPGTKYVKVVVLAVGGGSIYFDDIHLEEVK